MRSFKRSLLPLPSKTQRLPNDPATLRRAIPLGTYLFMMHQVTMTGHMPRFDEDGKPTGTTDVISPDKRIELMKYLTDKALPELPRETVTINLSAEDARHLTAKDIHALPASELRRIASGELSVETEPDGAEADGERGDGQAGAGPARPA
jgi:hypothetical protein